MAPTARKLFPAGRATRIKTDAATGRTGKRGRTTSGTNELERKAPARSPSVNTVRPDIPTAHVLVRARSEYGQTIDAHSKMVATHGTAMFGKLGKPVGALFRKGMNDQIERGRKTYLFITMREGWNGEYVTYRCPLVHVHETLDVAKRALVPSYYLAEAAKIQTLVRDQRHRTPES